MQLRFGGCMIFFFLSARSRVRQNYHISTAMEYRGASSQQPQQRRHEQQQAICTQSGWLQTPDLLSLTRHSARFLGWGCCSGSVHSGGFWVCSLVCGLRTCSHGCGVYVIVYRGILSHSRSSIFVVYCMFILSCQV